MEGWPNAGGRGVAQVTQPRSDADGKSPVNLSGSVKGEARRTSDPLALRWCPKRVASAAAQHW